MKGARVVINASFPMPSGWDRTGVVIAESERCLGIRVDNCHDLPLLVPKAYVRVLTEFS